MVIAEPLPYEHRVVCSQSAQVVSDLFRQVPMWSEADDDPHRRIVPAEWTKFAHRGLILLHEADDNAVKWLEDVATKAVAKYSKVKCHVQNYNVATRGQGRISWGHAVTPPIPRERSSSAAQFWKFSCIYAYAV